MHSSPVVCIDVLHQARKEDALRQAGYGAAPKPLTMFESMCLLNPRYCFEPPQSRKLLLSMYPLLPSSLSIGQELR